MTLSIPGPDHSYFTLEAARGKVLGVEIVDKFGSNDGVGTTAVPVCDGGEYRMPQIAGATKLRIAAGGNAADDAAGLGAQEITLIMMDIAGNLFTETLATAGVSASLDTVVDCIRLVRTFVSKSGSYATTAVGSHVATIVIENAAGTENWASIPLNSYAHGQSLVGMFTIPKGKTGWVSRARISIDATKPATVLFLERQGILKTTPPYDAMRVTSELVGAQGTVPGNREYPKGPFPELTDIGFLAALVTGSDGSVSVEFSIAIVDN